MSEKNLQQLKEYLKCIFELESALYKHNKLTEGYMEKRKATLPVAPSKKLPSPPSKPVFKSTYEASKNSKLTSKMIVLLIVFSITGFFGFFYIFFPLSMASKNGGEQQLQSMGFWGIILSAIAIYCYVLLNQEKKKQSLEIEKENQEKIKQYDRAMAFYKTEVRTAEKEHTDKMQNYYRTKWAYESETTEQLAKFDEMKVSLQTSLTKLYSQNILYAKYRNLVAVATIYEYFESGRCMELEGPNGAYNMYEGELRANIIICSLNQIISDLAQIKNGQYALYEQINRSTLEVNQMLGNIYDAQMLSAYYAEVAAKAATADRYTVGVIY